MSKVTTILKDLVALPSVNPRSATDLPPDLVGEQRVTEYVEGFIRGLKLDVIIQETGQPGRYNVGAAMLQGNDRGTLLLQSHMDTVGIGSDPGLLTPVERDGAIYGRGACDDKGSLAAMLAALEAVARTPDRIENNVIVMAVVGEETGFEGSLALVTQPPTAGADFAVVGEPTECRIVTGCKGVGRWRIETSGTACHSAYPDKGVNAIYRMARIVQELEGYQCELAGSIDDKLGPETVSVGTIRGGTAVNVVPDSCEIEVDRRLTRRVSPEQARDLVGQYLRGRGIDFEFAMSELSDAQPAALVEDCHPGVRLLAGVSRLLGLDDTTGVVSYASDANRMNAAGIPTVVWGPGSIEVAHSRQEFVSIADLETAVEFYRGVILATAL
ncbi:MAG: M20/M25/M40 family metallo-hydrolase [Armatimonadota bacterium]|nr:M20/M25/M40 family metallo-hydrolase [Armatimonadota bacterium]